MYQAEKHLLKRVDKIGLAFVPGLMFVGGTVNLYLALRIFQQYQKDKEIVNVLSEYGVFVDSRTGDEKA